YTQYANDPYSSSASQNTDTATVPVYTYGIETKLTDQSNNPLQGSFTVSGSDGNPIEFVKTGDGEYRKATSSDPASSRTTTVETDSNGNLKLTGLDTGDYKLHQTKTADGYILPGSDISVTITDDDHDGQVDANPATDNKGYVTTTVVNTKGFTLPMTGAAGIGLIAVIGLALAGAGTYVSHRYRATTTTSTK
ncbi:MAG: SpaA isopeptide-forming pilin-related protein, partial [Bifidobacteriaceae bacterium]|nr:SpaA isopeptide-forming pilin-related protein [Bifidobacteriaceae bacterium]